MVLSKTINFCNGISIVGAEVGASVGDVVVCTRLLAVGDCDDDGAGEDVMTVGASDGVEVEGSNVGKCDGEEVGVLVRAGDGASDGDGEGGCSHVQSGVQSSPLSQLSATSGSHSSSSSSMIPSPQAATGNFVGSSVGENDGMWLGIEDG